MLADTLVYVLNTFVLNLTNQDNPAVLRLEPREYERQLLNYYSNMTASITSDIKADLEWFSRENNEYLKREFLNQVSALKNHINTLLQTIESVDIDEKAGKMAKIQIDFCKQLQSFINELSLKIDEANIDALTDAQIDDCHFECLRGKRTEYDLSEIYKNLKASHWICSRHTSMGDFIYYFSGQGFKPSEPIHWKVSTAKLTLFLDEIVADDHIWSKASHIFLVKNKPVGKKVLGNTFSRCRKQESERTENAENLRREIVRMTYVEPLPKPFWME